MEQLTQPSNTDMESRYDQLFFLCFRFSEKNYGMKSQYQGKLFVVFDGMETFQDFAFFRS